MGLIPWSQLPQDLLASIGKCLEDHFDVVRFRSVCHSWRCSIGAPRNFPPLPMDLKFLTLDSENPTGHFSVSRRTIFRLELPVEIESSQPPFNNSWLIKVEEKQDVGTVSLIHPVSMFPMRIFLDSSQKEVNLLNFRIKQISTTFIIEQYETFDSSDDEYMEEDEEDEEEDEPEGSMVSGEVAFSAVPRLDDMNGQGIFSIRGELYSMSDVWNPEDRVTANREIVNYNGSIIAVIRNGIGAKNDGASLRTTHIVLPPKSFGKERYLLESCGDLFMVTRDFTVPVDFIYCDYNFQRIKRRAFKKVPDKFQVFKMNKVSQSPLLYQWEAVTNLGDQIFCVSRDCSYSIAVQDFPGTKGNCIYFVDDVLDDNYDHGLVDYNNILVYNLEDGVLLPISAFPGIPNLFSPPPALFGSNPSSSGN